MTLDAIIRYSIPDDIVVDRLVQLYPNMDKSKQGYYHVLNSLKKIDPEDSQLEIDIETVHDELDDEDYVSVSGWDKDEKVDYAIEYTPWSQWLSMKIRPKTLKNFTKLDILCHCLWEMTWSGFNEKEIQEQYADIMETAKEAKLE